MVKYKFEGLYANIFAILNTFVDPVVVFNPNLFASKYLYFLEVRQFLKRAKDRFYLTERRRPLN